MEGTPSDVLVIGGGIAGMLIARELRGLGASVTLLERGRLGEASSALNAGGVRQQFFQEENIRAAMATVAFLTAFRAEHGIDIGFRQPGYLYLYSTGAQRDRLQEGLTAQNAAGVPSRLVTLDEVSELAPAVSTGGPARRLLRPDRRVPGPEGADARHRRDHPPQRRDGRRSTPR